MQTVDIYDVDEEVLIKAKVAEVLFDKGKVIYKLKDVVTGKRLDYDFTAKDIRPVTAEPKKEKK